MKPNTLFPGLPDYVGSTSGLFSLLHHEGPIVEDSDDVMERIAFIRGNKPTREVDVRLAHIVYLDPELVPACAKLATLYADYEAKLATLCADYEAKLAPLDADYEAKLATLYADYEAKLAPLDAEIVAYLKPLIPDFRWDGKRLNFGVA